MYKNLADILNLTSSGLSIFGSLFIILSWFIFSDDQFFIRQIIMWLSVTDLISSLTFCISSTLHLIDNNITIKYTSICQGEVFFLILLGNYDTV